MKLLPLSALALAAALPATVALAAPTTYVYEVHNLLVGGRPANQPAFNDEEGVFTGEDLDGDRVIQLDELSLFTMGDAHAPWYGAGVFQLLPSVNTGVSSAPLCIPEPDPSLCDIWSGLQRFSYNLDTGAFDAAGDYAMEFHASYYLDTGNGAGVMFTGGGGNDLWTSDTYVSVRPIPEPGTGTLAALGLAGLGAWARRRRC